MPEQIAVCLGKNGKTAALFKTERIMVYQRREGNWTALRGIELKLDSRLSLKELRARMDAAIGLLAGCRILVGRSIVGIPYLALEKAGFSIWEAEGEPPEFLDYILGQEEEARLAAESRTEIDAALLPVETGNGCYRISIKEIQTTNAGITSKQVLLPFLRQGEFYALEIICSHVPPWLQAELAGGVFACDTEITGADEIRVTITRKCCQDG